MGHTVTVGAPSRSALSVRERRLGLRRSLTAGAAPIPLPTFDLTFGSEIERQFIQFAMQAGHPVLDSDRWPVEDDGSLFVDGTVVSRDGGTALHRLEDGTLAIVSLGYGWCTVKVAAASDDRLPSVFGAFRSRYPAAYLSASDDLRVPVTFWTNTPHGPVSRLRRIEAAEWGKIDGNYTAGVSDELERVMEWHDGPDADGQLMIWLGVPGTGKSWALRALADAWSNWAEFHYITDPDAFFVRDPSYMISVLLADSYEAMDIVGDVYSETDEQGKWRVLILEDTGELLAADAKDEYGQGLSRLLNVVDGMIGQGLRVLALVTTNDELGDLHPAAVRPGRCASRIEFGPLTDEEAQAWTGDVHATAGTIAELYALTRPESAQTALASDEPEDARDLMASAAVHASDCAVHNDPAFENGPCDCGSLAASADAGPVAEIQAVAESHAPDGGYGDTWWRASDRTVFWNAADWSSSDEVDAAESAFLSIEDVDRFEYDAEVGDMSGEGYECVYPPSGSAKLEDVVALASEPLDLASLGTLQADVPETVLQEFAAELSNSDEDDLQSAVASALKALADSHRSTVDGITAVLASASQNPGAADQIALEALGVLRAFAERPETAPAKQGDIHVHVPKQDLSVSLEGATFSPHIDVNVPEQRAPEVTVNVEAPAAPEIIVHVPEQAAPQVVVAAAAPAAAPVVHVHVPQVPEPRPRTVRREYDDAGIMRFVVEEQEEA